MLYEGLDSCFKEAFKNNFTALYKMFLLIQ